MIIAKDFPGLILVPPSAQAIAEGCDPNDCDYMIDGDLNANEDVEIALNDLLLVKGNVNINGKLKTRNHLRVTGNITAHSIEARAGEIEVGGDIEATDGDITSGGDIVSGGNIKCKGNISIKSFAKAEGYISAGLNIDVSCGISAKEHIRCGGALESGKLSLSTCRERNMILPWNIKIYLKGFEPVRSLNGDEHGEAVADWGIFQIKIFPKDTGVGPWFQKGCDRECNYTVAIFTKFPSPGERLGTWYGAPLLLKTGFLRDVIKATEELVFSESYVTPAMQG